MKKILVVSLFCILLIVSFVGGTRFSQHEAIRHSNDNGDRRILHYVDPMNPANTSSEPGIAPCGMPMEPVYADADMFAGSVLSTSPGAVRINFQKQQIIGVQTATAKKVAETVRIRALGQIAADENKVYSLVAATDGWMGEIHESTTGSLVRKNQLMGKIRVYDYDFFTWQQRYLTELGNAGRRRVFLSPLSGAVGQLKKVISDQQKKGSLIPDVGGAIALPSNNLRNNTDAAETRHGEAPAAPRADKPRLHSTTTEKPWGIPPGATHYGKPPQGSDNASPNRAHAMAKDKSSMDIETPGQTREQVPELPTGPVPELPMGPDPESPEVPTPKMDVKKSMESTVATLPKDLDHRTGHPADSEAQPQSAPMISSGAMHDGGMHQGDMASSGMKKQSAKAVPDQSQHVGDMTRKTSGDLFFTREDDILYASKARQELLDLGVVESQLRLLAEKGVYLTHVELRSPVDGLVLSRNVTTRQRVNRGTECFRVADLRKVWVETDIYDTEAEYIHPGMQARVSLPKIEDSYPATVTDVLPRYEGSTRSLKVRLEMDNPGIVFRPEMFVDVEFFLDMPASITVPTGAVIDSGENKTLYVVVDEGIFEPRAVVTGWQFNDRIEILAGLKTGEQFVVSGNFLIDSESRMKLAAVRLMDSGDDSKGGGVNSEAPAPSHQETSPARIKSSNDDQKVEDLVCGMYIDPEEAEKAGLVIEADGKKYYFCSEECVEEFYRHGPSISQQSAPHSAESDSPDHAEHQMAVGTSPSTVPPMAQEAEAKDPICGMSVDKETAMRTGLAVENRGEILYFCSEPCKQSFLQNLQRHSPPDSMAGPGHEGHSHD